MLQTNKMVPVGVSVKVSHIRPEYDSLEEWCRDPANVLVTRRGRIFITDRISRTKRIFHYPESEWANPFKLSDHSLEESLKLYSVHLDQLLRNTECMQRFLELRQARRLGCFCEPGEPCHRDVILQKLSRLCGPQND